MARPVWTGTLSFGLVTLPIALYPATSSHSIPFRQIQRGTGDRVRNRRVNERTGEEVPFADALKGFELAEGQYVIVEPEELEQISPGRSKAIDIAGFVDLAEIDPIYFATPYYIAPKDTDTGSDRVYRLLAQALTRSKKAGLALFAMRGKEYLTAVRADRGLLVAQTMRFADEIRDPSQVPNIPEEGEAAAVGEKELATAETLIDMLGIAWNPAEWRETYAQQVRELIEAKAAGNEIAFSKPAEATNVVDLMGVLDRSLQTASARRGEIGAGQGREPAPVPPTAAPTPLSPGRPGRAARPGRVNGSRSLKGAGGKKTTAAGRDPAKREDLAALTKPELYARASDLGIPHRSAMNRAELQAAVQRVTATAGRRRLRTAT